MKRFAVLILLAGCSSGPESLETIGLRLQGESDPATRLALVRDIMESGDHRMVPLLIDALVTVGDRGKRPDADYTTTSVTPETRGPELWALIIVTRQDFKRDAAAWREWWGLHGAGLHWDGGQKCFIK